jgi:aminotransferase
MNSPNIIPFNAPQPRDFIADHVRALPRSGIRDFFEIVQTMPEVISLGIGEPDFVTPWHIREAAIRSLEKGRTGYTSNLGLPKLRQLIATHVERSIGVRYEPLTEVLVTVGVSEALDLAMRAVLNPGDEVLYHEPCYVSYSPSIALAHGKAVAIQTRAENGFRLLAQDIAAQVTPRSKVLLLNFPCNPTGACLDLPGLEAIAEVARRHDLLVIADEIYSELSYERPHVSISSLPGMRERTLFLHGFSKAYAMTGFRIGYVCAPVALTEAMMKIHQYSMLCAGITSQEAAIEALTSGAEDVVTMREEYHRRRNFMVNSLRDLGLKVVAPEGAFYLFPNIRATGLTAHEFALRLLQEEKVAVVPGTAFGPSGEGFVRCSYATGMSQLEKAVTHLARFLKRLGG